MSRDLKDEFEAINSIYGSKTLQKDVQEHVYILAIPHHEVSLRLSLPNSYPQEPPRMSGIEWTGPQTRKGYGSHVHDAAEQILKETFTPGSVCLFDLIQDLDICLRVEINKEPEKESPSQKARMEALDTRPEPPYFAPPRWSASSVVTEKKSSFLAHATSVQTPAAVRHAMARLLSTDRKVAKATHNITAYRMRDPENPAVTYQDYDDDGETAAGARLLHLLQAMDVWDILVVVTRWFGGVKLGPDRFRLINQVAREAVAEGKGMKSKEATI